MVLFYLAKKLILFNLIIYLSYKFVFKRTIQIRLCLRIMNL